MTKPHPVHLALTGLLMLLSGLPLASRAGEPLIVVEDRGGTSALPYYEALNLQPRANAPARPPIPTPQVPATPADEAAMLPVRWRAAGDSGLRSTAMPTCRHGPRQRSVARRHARPAAGLTAA